MVLLVNPVPKMLKFTSDWLDEETPENNPKLKPSADRPFNEYSCAFENVLIVANTSNIAIYFLPITPSLNYLNKYNSFFPLIKWVGSRKKENQGLGVSN